MADSKYEIVKVCAYCERAKCLYDEQTMLCSKKGVVDASHSCHKFIYDPLKRTVNVRPIIPHLDKDDIL